MKKRILFIGALLAIVFMGATTFHGDEEKSLCDAPLLGAAHSGAPGEVNCSGCHSGTINSGPGSMLFDMGVPGNEYIPGTIYTASVKMSQTSVDKFGFQLISLKDSNNSFAGAYTLTDAVNTRIINGTGGKKYVGTTKCGSDTPTDSIEWSFDWIAPSVNEGNITVYLSGLSTDHSHSTSGDDTYTQTLQLTPKAPTSVKETSEIIQQINIYPNPATESLQIQYALEQNIDVNIDVFDINGRLIEQIRRSNQSKGQHVYSLVLDKENYKPGFYIIKLRAGDRTSNQKFEVNK